MKAVAQHDILQRLTYVEGHLSGIRRMIAADRSCVDVVMQAYAVRNAITKIELLLLQEYLDAGKNPVTTSRKGADRFYHGGERYGDVTKDA